MDIRVLDEVVEIENAGLMLFAHAEDGKGLFSGCKLRDARGYYSYCGYDRRS